MACAHTGELDHSEMVKIVHDFSQMLGLKTLISYAKSEGISYPAAAKRKNEVIKIDRVEFIIDND